MYLQPVADKVEGGAIPDTGERVELMSFDPEGVGPKLFALIFSFGYSRSSIRLKLVVLTEIEQQEHCYITIKI